MIRKLFFLAIIIVISIPHLKGNSRSKYAEISLKGAVNPVVAQYIVESIDRAHADNADFIILTIDTPGGLISSMRDIIKAILSSKIPVITYTYPKGAQAASAGGFIMLAGNINAMAPGTEIGAMHPVSPVVDFNQKEDIMVKKVLNDTIAYGKSLAQKRNRNVKWTIEAIEIASSSTYKEAKKLNVIDHIADDIPDLLKKIHGSEVKINGKRVVINSVGAEKVSYLMGWKEKFLNLMADPQVIFLLFIIAAAGIGMEMKSPGAIFPGTIGGISLVLFLLAVQVVPINIFGLLLIILAVVLFILEVNITSYGLLTLGGLASFVLGSLILFDSPLPGYSVPIPSIIATLIFLLVVIFFIVRSIINVHKSKVSTGMSSMIGEEGVALKEFSKGAGGKVHIHGEIWNAISDELINKDDQISVEEINGMTLKIKKID